MQLLDHVQYVLILEAVDPTGEHRGDWGTGDRLSVGDLVFINTISDSSASSPNSGSPCLFSCVASPCVFLFFLLEDDLIVTNSWVKK